MRIRLPLIVAALSVAVVAGCTTTSEGTPSPDSSSDSSSEQSSDAPTTGDDLPSDGAPKVENPLDVARFVQSPCDTLTAEQTQELNIPATGEQGGNSTVKGCRWRNKETSGSVSVDFFPGDKRGLSSVYREAKGSNFAYFEQIPDIEGYPAVAFHPDAAEPTVDCVVSVGITDQLAFSARAALSDANIGKKKPCEVTSLVADMVMKTMREAT